MDAPGDSRKTSRQDRSFADNGGGLGSGDVRTPALNAKAIQVRPDEKLARGLGDRVYAGQTDLGAVWRTIDEGDDAALSVTLAEIGDGEPANAALVVIDGVHSLVWSRSTPKAD